MANQGNLAFPYELEIPELVLGAPDGFLVDDAEVVTSSDGVSAILSNRFPVPPTAGGFCVDIDFGMETLGLSGPYLIVGALMPESGYLEPTIGQIWPRIG